MSEQRDEADFRGAGPEDQFWELCGVETGVVVGIDLERDDRLSTRVSMVLHMTHLEKPGRFVMDPDDADQLASFLVTAARMAREHVPGMDDLTEDKG